MAVNLIEILQGQLGNSLVKQASSFLGETESKTESAISGILPALLGTMTKKAGNNSGANALFNAIKDGGFDGSSLNDVAGLFSGGQKTTNLLKSGGGILDMLAGNKLGGIVNAIASFSGVSKGSSKSLLSMAAPLLMSVIGKQVKTNNLGVTGLVDLLKGQSGFIGKMMPSGLASLSSSLGLADLGDGVKQTASRATNTVRETATATRTAATQTTEKASGGIGKILPWLGLLLLGLLGAYFLRGCDGAVGDVANKVTETTENAVDATKDAATTVVETTGDVVEGAGDALTGAAKAAREKLGALTFEIGSFGDRMSKFLSGSGDGDGRFTFDKVTFATGSAKLAEESKEQLDNLATMMDAYPKVKINVEGYTDNTGNADKNKTLSQDRADIVRAYLVGKGVAVDRMGATGYGDANPVGDNATAEGRAANRRIDVVVTAR